MASFLAQIGLKMPRKGENNNYRSVPFRSYLTLNRKFQKNSKKIQKTKQYQILWLHYKPKLVGKRREREKIKIIVPFRSYTTRNRKFQKIAKKLEKLNNTIMDSFQAKIGWKRPRKRKNKNYRSVPFLHNA